MLGRSEVKRRASRAMQAVRRSIPHHRWEVLRDRVHPALRQTVASALSPSPASMGRVSVIVPCYNVEEYLADCLDSIVRQKYRDLEIIVVIDGSPDRSIEIARGYARWDRRISVVEQPNAGLGAARNTGIRLARGEFIAFVDSDDTLPPKAIETMVSCLSASGSDFVVGNLERRNAARSWVPLWAQDVHRRDRIGLRLDDFPEVLADVFAWNKLFRREFFDRAVGSFPEGIRYEDQEPSAKAYSSAAAFDVLHDVVYSWYIRGDGTSITQQKSNIADLTDRLTVMSKVADVLRTRASEHVLHEWQAKSLGLDLRSYYNEVPRTGDDYWQALASGVAAVAEGMDPQTWGLVSLHDRLLARMVEQGHRDDIRTALRRRSEVGDAWEADFSVEPPQARPLYLEDLPTFRPTAADLALTAVDNRMRVTVFGYEVEEDDLVVTGMAWVPGLDLASSPTSLTAHLVDESVDGPLTPDSDLVLSVERFDDVVLDELAAQASPSQATSGFRVRVDLADLAAALEARHPAVDDVVESHPGWHLELELELDRGDERAPHRWRSPVTAWDRRWTGNELEVSPLHDGKRVVPVHSAARGLHFHLFAPRVAASQARLDGRDLHLVASSDAPISEFTISCGPVGVRRSFPAVPVDGGYAATITVPPLPSGASPTTDHRWGLRAVVPSGTLPVVYAGSSGELSTSSPHTGGLRLGLVGPGRLRMLDRKLHASVHAVDVADDLHSFTVTGYAAPDVGAEPILALVSDQDTWLPSDVRLDASSGRFQADFELSTERWGTSVARSTGGYSLRLLRAPGVVDRSVWVPVAPHTVEHVSPHFLHWHRGDDVSFRFTVTSRARALWVNTRAPVPEQDWTRAGQFAARRGIPALLGSPVEDGVLFSTFGGRSAADSPLALYNELVRRDYPHPLVWEVADGTAVVPEGARSVVIGTREHLRALHTSRHLVANNNFPFYFHKHPDQTYVQTWHGTPLKKIGRHVPAPNLSLSYRDLMVREAKAWDLLLAQNDFSATALADALGFEGEVLNVGYPRNDLLSTGSEADRARVRARVRARLGVPQAARLVLYAPTWRDNVRTASGGYAMVNHLELDAVSRAFGSGSVLLVRGHSNTPGLGDSTAANIIDVSSYPDITELMLVADVLITDYSSVMFDFVGTGRPMLFLTPDVAEYAGSTRGFYLDFAEIAPGPLLSSTDSVLQALEALPRTETAYRDRYEAFRDQFAPRDDGKAAIRVVDAVWGR